MSENLRQVRWPPQGDCQSYSRPTNTATVSMSQSDGSSRCSCCPKAAFLSLHQTLMQYFSAHVSACVKFWHFFGKLHFEKFSNPQSGIYSATRNFELQWQMLIAVFMITFYAKNSSCKQALINSHCQDVHCSQV